MTTSTPSQTILIVDDTPKNIQVLGITLREAGYHVNVARSGREALESVNAMPPDLILLDIMMPEMDGFETCRRLKAADATRDIPVIFLTAKMEKDDILNGFGVGAVDYVTKPFHAMELLMRVNAHTTNRMLQKALEVKNTALQHELRVAQELFKEACSRIDGPLLGDGAAIRSVRELIARFAKSDHPVLLSGPPGAGDEVIARAIHSASDRRGRAFIRVNCAQHKSTETGELFSVPTDRADVLDGTEHSLFDLADGGTLYLDRVQELSAGLQQQLTATLSTLELQRNNNQHPVADVKVVAYISIDLSQQTRSTSLSPSLFDHLRRQTITIPPLSDRTDDLPILAEHFVKQHAQRLCKSVDKLSDESMKRLAAYSWPGNIDELHSVLEHVVASATDSLLEINEELLDRGQHIDRYRLIKKIGEGGMGEVWLAKHQLLARPVALKLIHTDDLDDREYRKIALKRFKREAQTTAQLQCINTIQLFDYGATDTGDFYFVMELLRGMDLGAMVGRFGPLEPERIVFLLRQACRSLIEAHGIGLIHRDIKPQNLFVCKLGPDYDFLKVLDFGLVKRHDDEITNTGLTAVGAVPGTAISTAPEMIESNAEADARSDLYSLGCVAYQLLTGQYVFFAGSILELYAQHVNALPKAPSEVSFLDIPAEVDEIVLQCLAKNPDDRPQSASELWRRLGKIRFEKPWTQRRAQQWWMEKVGKQTAKKANGG